MILGHFKSLVFLWGYLPKIKIDYFFNDLLINSKGYFAAAAATRDPVP